MFAFDLNLFAYSRELEIRKGGRWLVAEFEADVNAGDGAEGTEKERGERKHIRSPQDRNITPDC
jgi:hypothetical protein